MAITQHQSDQKEGGKMKLVQLFQKYQDQLYEANLSNDQKWAIRQILSCKKDEAGQLDYQCHHCHEHMLLNHSCGHRFCPQCGYQNNQAWLNRQQQKLLPVDYFMVTFTLPYELRSLTKKYSKIVFPILIKQAVKTVQEFFKNDKNLSGKIGLTAVLHTHSRKNDFHPHVHLIVPIGSLTKNNQWKSKRKKYLFKEKNLAKVFRAKFITEIKSSGLRCQQSYPETWIAHCKRIGNGNLALKYLSQYLYRGVFSEKNLISLNQDQLTWQYKDSNTKKYVMKKEPAINFLIKLLQHVLPKGFRRIRDYGLLHSSNKLTLKRIQFMLNVHLPAIIESFKAIINCPCCGEVMTFCGFIKRKCRTAII